MVRGKKQHKIDISRHEAPSTLSGKLTRRSPFDGRLLAALNTSVSEGEALLSNLLGSEREGANVEDVVSELLLRAARADSNGEGNPPANPAPFAICAITSSVAKNWRQPRVECEDRESTRDFCQGLVEGLLRVVGTWCLHCRGGKRVDTEEAGR